MEFIDERAMPWIERNRVMVLGIALGVLVGVGAAVMIARRSRPRPLVARLRDATTSVGERLERPIISTIRSATDRISG